LRSIKSKLMEKWKHYWCHFSIYAPIAYVTTSKNCSLEKIILFILNENENRQCVQQESVVNLKIENKFKTFYFQNGLL
jgi:hypothetical protein